VINVDELTANLLSSCAGEEFLGRVHSEVQDTIIDVAELGVSDEVLVKVLGIYAVAQALRWVRLNVNTQAPTEALSDDYVRVIQCLADAIRGKGAGDCHVSSELCRRALQHGLTLINEVKVKCLSDL
jgi:hypothetical protein